ncbi:integrase core domain-containing protein [Spiroplasma tabanidicola]|uniref:integrase core domain-containing protein n=1 Tax=Spiroplasma tabanidicola TaxID=324079 RepID=UPI0012DEE482
MSRRDNSHNNGACESFFGTIKNECIYTYKTKELNYSNIYTIISDYIDFYNYVRPNLKHKKNSIRNSYGESIFLMSILIDKYKLTLFFYLLIHFNYTFEN